MPGLPAEGEGAARTAGSPRVGSCGLAVAFLFLQGSWDGSQHLPLMGFTARALHISTPVLLGLLRPPSCPPRPVVPFTLSSPCRTIFACPTSQGPVQHVVLCVQNIPQSRRSVLHLCSPHGCLGICIAHAVLHHPCRCASPTCICITHVRLHHPRRCASPTCICVIHVRLHHPRASASPGRFSFPSTLPW